MITTNKRQAELELKKNISFTKFKKLQYDLYASKTKDAKSFNFFCMDNKEVLRNSYDAMIDKLMKNAQEKAEKLK